MSQNYLLKCLGMIIKPMSYLHIKYFDYSNQFTEKRKSRNRNFVVSNNNVLYVKHVPFVHENLKYL